MKISNDKLRGSFHGKYKKTILSILIFILAFGIRLSYMKKTIVPNPFMKDSGVYLSYAKNLVQYNTFSKSKGPNPVPDNLCETGYPFFIAAFLKVFKDLNTSYAMIIFTQIILGSLTAIIVFAIGIRFLPLWAATGAAILTAFSPHLIATTSYFLTETLFTFIMTAAILIMAEALENPRPFFFFAASFIMGIACLVRPALMLFPVFIIPYVFFIKKPPKRILVSMLLILGIITAIAPWELWKKSRTTIIYDKSSLFSRALVLGFYPDLIYKTDSQKGFPYAEDKKYDEMTSDLGLAFTTLWQRAKKSPMKYLNWYIAGKPAMFWSWDVLQGYEDVYIYPVKNSLFKTSAFAGAIHKVMKILHPILIIMTMAGFAGLVLISKSGGSTSQISVDIGLLVISLLFYFTAIHTILAPLPRYSIPLRPMLYLGAFIPFMLPGLKINKRD
ncbi:MAG: hypothetical protein HN737_04955 [Desulfobacterales bacterium]|nr:hypothetical protein [Desulfobacterales bacterium]